MTIYLKSEIKERAEAAARLDPAAFNPYPHHTDAYALFKKYFEIERSQLAREDIIQVTAAKGIHEHLAA